VKSGRNMPPAVPYRKRYDAAASRGASSRISRAFSWACQDMVMLSSPTTGTRGPGAR
jgi:hypothetical protein